MAIKVKQVFKKVHTPRGPRGSSIAPCKCTHLAQDAFYGKGQRVFNHCAGQGDGIYGRCTVCTSVKFLHPA